MTIYRSLLVHLDDHPRCSARTELAIRLARQWDAHLVGLSPTGRLPLPAEAGPALPGLDTVTLLLTHLRRLADERAQRFRERCREAGLKSFEAVVDDEDGAASVIQHSRCSDFVVIGQAEPGVDGAAAARTLVEQVVLQSARPTLVLPYAGRFDAIGENVLVAWDDSREAARAVADAMPLLCRAQRVTVLQCETPLMADGAGTRERLDAIHQWLMWHGVEADVRLEVTEIDVGNALLSRAADAGIDLLVMGAYGHPRWAERVLGGATRTLLANMTVPVLMSH